MQRFAFVPLLGWAAAHATNELNLGKDRMYDYLGCANPDNPILLAVIGAVHKRAVPSSKPFGVFGTPRKPGEYP